MIYNIHFLGSLPFGVNIVLLPLVLVFVMVMSCITLSFILNIPIKFNFFHLISFSFGDHGTQRNDNGNVLTGQTVEKLLDIVKETNNSNRFIEGSEPITISEDALARELIRQLSQNENKDNGIQKLSQKMNQICLKSEENNSKKSNLEQIDSDAENILEKSDFVEKLKEILESPSIDNVAKPGFEPDIIEEKLEESNDSLRKRKHDGAGDF